VSRRHPVCVIGDDHANRVMTAHPARTQACGMPITDGMSPRRFPVVNVLIIAANLAVWIFYQLPNFESSVMDSSFYVCGVDGSCQPELPWYVSWFTAMFMHGSWSHILGNMWFLAIFGKNVEDAFGHLRYLLMYVAGGFAAAALQTIMTLMAGSAADAQVPMLGASGAIAAVLGAYWVLYPDARILTLVFVFFVKVRAWVFLGLWFLYQLVAANMGLFAAGSEDGGTAFFAHVGGFVFGVIVATILARSGQRQDQRTFDAVNAGPARMPRARFAGRG
jgi:membrane associated rhomboid family serine protease